MLEKQDIAFMQDSLPFWQKLSAGERQRLVRGVSVHTFSPGGVLHSGAGDCAGLFLLQSGQVRAYMVSESGRELTLFRLFERDICLFSASCMMKDIRFDVMVEAERATRALLLPTGLYHTLEQNNIAVAEYTQQLISSRFSDVMWLMEQVLFTSFDRRLAAFLLEQANLEGGSVLRMTHEQIARNLGSAREVVSRMLKYFESEKMVALRRGGVELLDKKRLQKLAGE